MIVIRMFSGPGQTECENEFTVDMVTFDRGVGMMQYHIPGMDGVHSCMIRGYSIEKSITAVLVYNVILEAV